MPRGGAPGAIQELLVPARKGGASGCLNPIQTLQDPLSSNEENSIKRLRPDEPREALGIHTTPTNCSRKKRLPSVQTVAFSDAIFLPFGGVSQGMHGTVQSTIK
jgi:hypothetical protein